MYEHRGSGSLATGASESLLALNASPCFVFSLLHVGCQQMARDCTCSELGQSVKLQQLSFTKLKGPVPLLVKLPREVWRLFCSWLDHNYLRSYFLFCYSNFDQKWKILRYLKTILTGFFENSSFCTFFFKELNLLRKSLVDYFFPPEESIFTPFSLCFSTKAIQKIGSRDGHPYRVIGPVQNQYPVL